MPRDLFGDVSDPSVRVGSRKWYAVPLSLIVHTIVLLLVVVIPLVATGALPDPRTTLNFVPVVPDVPLPPPAPRAPTPERPRANPNAPPTEIPTAITEEPPESDFENRETIVDGLPGGNTVDGSPGALTPPPPPPAAVKPVEPVHIGGLSRSPERIRYVAPTYPPIALSARIQGVVIIEATIGADGRVINARLLRSVQMLDEAALAAVRQWTYTPTLLNGVPVPVIMTVTVNFSLQ